MIGNGGEILTNNHVVAGAEVIKVGLFGDTKSSVAKPVGRDPISDSALIRLERPPSGLPSATFGDSDALEPGGDWVMAIGNRHVVHNAQDARRVLAGIEAGNPVFLLVWRQGNEMFLQVRPE